jgi:hypothetical protein
MNELIKLLRQQYLEMICQYTANNDLKFPENDTINKVWKENAQSCIDVISKDIREANEAFLCNGKATAMMQQVITVTITHEALKMAKLTVN